MNPFIKIKNWLHHHQISKQASRFLLVGGSSAIISYTTFVFCIHLLKLHYLLANLGGFILSIGFSYYCNRVWTFDACISKKFKHYFSFYLFSFFLSSALLKFIVELVGIRPEIANIITISTMTCFNFLGVKFVVFKR